MKSESIRILIRIYSLKFGSIRTLTSYVNITLSQLCACWHGAPVWGGALSSANRELCPDATAQARDANQNEALGDREGVRV